MDTIESLGVDISDLGLSSKELKFVGEYCNNGFNESSAAMHAGLITSKATAAESRIATMELINKANIKTAIQRFTQAILEPYRDRFEFQSIKQLMIRAFYNISDFYNDDRTTKPLNVIPKEMHVAIDSISDDYKGKDANVRTITYKLADRAAARKELRELLKQTSGGSDDDDSEIPQDRRKFLQDLFAKGMKQGAEIAIDAFKQGAEEKQADTITVKHEVVDEPKPSAVAILNSPKIQEALEKQRKRKLSGEVKKSNEV